MSSYVDAGHCKTIASSVDINTIATPGHYYMSNSSANAPFEGYLDVYSYNDNFIKQVAYTASRTDERIVFRTKQGGTWGSWADVALSSKLGTQVEILNATETSVTEKTLSQSIDNFRYIIIEALSNNGAIFSSQIVPVAIFKTHTSNTNPIMIYFYDGSGYKNMFVRYSNTTTVYAYVTSGFHLILRGIK